MGGERIPSEQQLEYLVVLGLLVGLFMLAFGLLKLGFLVRFISNAVMTGFLSGLGVLTILSQVGDLTHFSSEASNKVMSTIDTVIHWREIDPLSLVVGLIIILIILAVNRTRLGKYSFLIAVLLTTALVAFFDPGTVALVGDTTEIPRSLPSLNFPDLSLIPALILPALAIAIIALVQAAGVSGSIPNPDGNYPDSSGDFRGQGAGNLAVGLVGGIPSCSEITVSKLESTVSMATRVAWARVNE